MARVFSFNNDCRRFWGLSPHVCSKPGGMHSRVGAGDTAGKVSCTHKVGEEDLKSFYFVGRAPASVCGCLK